MYSLTLPFTFVFKFFLYIANPAINLTIDPRANITIESVTQVFQTLVSQTGHSNVRNGLDEEVNSWARWAQMNPNLYGDKETTNRLKKAFATSTDYQKQKKKTMIRFLGILAAHPEARVRALADSVPDPEMDRNTFRFFLLVRGAKSPSKHYVVNSAMTIFAVNLTMFNKNDDSVLDLTKLTAKEKANLQYQPSSFSTFYKHIFSFMKNEGVAFEQSNFTSTEGMSTHPHIFQLSFVLILTRMYLHLSLYRFIQSGYQRKVRGNVERASRLWQAQVFSRRYECSIEDTCCLQ